jgi:hypothetical protein
MMNCKNDSWGLYAIEDAYLCRELLKDSSMPNPLKALLQAAMDAPRVVKVKSSTRFFCIIFDQQTAARACHSQ